MEKELYILMREYMSSYIDSIPEAHRNSVNTNRMSFYGFYLWLRERNKDKV